MNITKAKYYKDRDGKNTSINATIDEIDWLVPIAEDNTDYQAILKWVAEGNTIEEAD